MNNYNFLLILKLSLKTFFFNNRVTSFNLKRLLILIIFIPVFLSIQISNRIFLFLDNVFFNRYKKVKIKNLFLLSEFLEVEPPTFIM